jgi:hypothetical protein
MIKVKVTAVPCGSIDTCIACFVNRAAVVIQLGRVDPYSDYAGNSSEYKLCARCARALMDNLHRQKEAPTYAHTD